MMTVTKAREICRFCLALVTVLMLWGMVSGIRAGGAVGPRGTRARNCAASVSAQRAVPHGRTVESGTVERR